MLKLIRSRPTIPLAFAAFILLSFPEAMLGVAWPFMRAEFGVPLDALGALLVAATIGHTLGSFANGALGERWGATTLLLVAQGVRLAAWSGYFVAPAWWGVVGSAFLAGLGAGLTDVGLNAYFAAHHSPRTMNWLHASFGLGATLGPVVMTAVLNQALSWRLGFLVAAGLQGLLLVAYVATRRVWLADPPPAADALPAVAGDGGRPLAGSRPAATVARYWLLGLSLALFFLLSGAEATAGNWAFSLFTEGRGIGVALAGAWVSLYWGSFTAGRIIFGLFANRLRPVPLVRANLLGILAGSLLLWWRPADLVSFLGLALIGFSLAPVFPMLVLATPQRFGPRQAARVIGYQIGVAGLGLALLPTLAGVLAERIDLEILGPFLVVTAVLLIGLHEGLLRHEAAGRRRLAALTEGATE